MAEVKDKIRERSHDGLDILIKVLGLSEDVRMHCLNHNQSPAFQNPTYNDKHASCFLFYARQNEPRQWMLKDHGLGEFAQTWWQVYCTMRGLADTRDDFGKNVSDLCAYMGYDDIIGNARRKGPDTETRFATLDEPEHSDKWEPREEMTPHELRWLFGPAVNETRDFDGMARAREVAKELGWVSCKWISHTGGRKMHRNPVTGNYEEGVKTIIKHCDDDYMVFVRSCRTEDGLIFYKIYRSNPESWIDRDGKPQSEAKCQYTPKGSKVPNFVNGLFELSQSLKTYIASHSDASRLPAVTICSGERDALCCRFYGQYPVWFNNDTDLPTGDMISSIKKFCDTIYLIPDVDGAGIKGGILKALTYIDIATIWLNETDMSGTNDRGKACKDFRDYVEDHPRQHDIDLLWRQARKAKFWSVETKNDTTKFKLLMVNMRYFLTLNGFWRYDDGKSEPVDIVHVDGYEVEKSSESALYDFVNRYVQYVNPQVTPIQELVAKVQTADLKRLPARRFNFVDCTPHSQMIFFDNCIVDVSAKGANIIRREDNPQGHYVWSQNIIHRNFRRLKDPCHRIYVDTDDRGRKRVRVKINMTETNDDFGSIPWPVSNVQGVYINSSRTEWRTELQDPYNAPGMEQEQEAYRRMHRFDLFGPNLNADQQQAQAESYIAKVFATGYLRHREKMPSLALAVMCLDNKIDEEGHCNGRSGKSFICTFISKQGMTVTPLDGRVKNLMANSHVFADVTRDTDIIFIDDISPDVKVMDFYTAITGTMRINPKNRDPFSLDFDESPKFLLSSNYVFSDLSSSTLERVQPETFADFYHGENTETGEQRWSIKDDFNMELLTKQYSPYYWNCDDNFLVDCLQSYFVLLEEFGSKINPPMRNILKRQDLETMGKHFHQWAVKWFKGQDRIPAIGLQPEQPAIPSHLDQEVVKAEAYAACIGTRGLEYLTAQNFMTKLKAFADYYDYELNPREFCNKSTDNKKPGAIKTLRNARMPGYDNAVEVLIMMDNRDHLMAYFARKRQNVVDSANPLDQDDASLPFVPKQTEIDF